MSPATDEENSNIMLLLDAAEELHKTASHDGPEPSTAATHGMLQPGCVNQRMIASHAWVISDTVTTQGTLQPGCLGSTMITTCVVTSAFAGSDPYAVTWVVWIGH